MNRLNILLILLFLLSTSIFASTTGKIRGKVIDETMKTLVIKNTKTHRIAKQNAIFKINIGDKIVQVEGQNLIGKPENRVKKKKKGKW